MQKRLQSMCDAPWSQWQHLWLREPSSRSTRAFFPKDGNSDNAMLQNLPKIHTLYHRHWIWPKIIIQSLTILWRQRSLYWLRCASPLRWLNQSWPLIKVWRMPSIPWAFSSFVLHVWNQVVDRKKIFYVQQDISVNTHPSSIVRSIKP